MLYKLKDLQGDAILAADGEIGSVDDLYFDDEGWDVRYVVVDGGRRVPGRKYLVSPVAIDRERPLAEGELRVGLTRDEIRRSPAAAGAARLRSSAQVIGYRVQARDGPVGSVADLVVDDDIWAITDMVVDSRGWLPGKLLLIAPSMVARIDWRARTLHLRLARGDILGAPEVQF